MFNDFCTEDGAKRLARLIEEYWRDRGYAVDVKLIEAGFMPAMRAARTDVRSNMVNGFPRRESVGQGEAKQERTFRPVSHTQH
ncbi:MAG: hypothetical protein ABWZ40_05540 [Caulobacterales bacterium]